MPQREWTQPVTVVIHDALMPAFEAWIQGRNLQLAGPLQLSDEPGDEAWVIAPKIMPPSYLCEKCDHEVRVLESESNQHEYDAHRMDGAYWFPEDDAAMEAQCSSP